MVSTVLASCWRLADGWRLALAHLIAGSGECRLQLALLHSRLLGTSLVDLELCRHSRQLLRLVLGACNLQSGTKRCQARRRSRSGQCMQDRRAAHLRLESRDLRVTFGDNLVLLHQLL